MSNLYVVNFNFWKKNPPENDQEESLIMVDLAGIADNLDGVRSIVHSLLEEYDQYTPCTSKVVVEFMDELLIYEYDDTYLTIGCEKFEVNRYYPSLKSGSGSGIDIVNLNNLMTEV